MTSLVKILVIDNIVGGVVVDEVGSADGGVIAASGDSSNSGRKTSNTKC